MKPRMIVGILILYCKMVNSMVITNFDGSRKELEKQFHQFKHLKTTRKNVIKDMDQANRANLCENIFDSKYFKFRNYELADRTNGEIESKIIEEYPSSYELYYFRESMNTPAIPFYPAFEMSIRLRSSVIREIVTPCLGVRKSSRKELLEVFISDGFKDNTKFIHEKDNVIREIELRAIAEEEGEVDSTLLDTDNLENYYVHLREASKTITNDRNPLSTLNENQLYRLLATVFGAEYFRFTKKMRFNERKIDYNIRNKFISLSGPRWDTHSLYTQVISGNLTYANDVRRSETFHIGWGYNAKDRSVFVFKNSGRGTGITPVYYVKNVPVFLKPTYS